jgi:hypothetical protein
LIGKLDGDVEVFRGMFDRVFAVFEGGFVWKTAGLFIDFSSRNFSPGMQIIRAFEDRNNWDAVLCYKALPEAVKALDASAPATALMIEAALSALKEYLFSAFLSNTTPAYQPAPASAVPAAIPPPLPSAPATQPDPQPATQPALPPALTSDVQLDANSEQSDWEKLILG